jgi:hypothetical protein
LSLGRQKLDQDLAVHWGKPVHCGSRIVGYVTISDRGWGGFDTAGVCVTRPLRSA